MFLLKKVNNQAIGIKRRWDFGWVVGKTQQYRKRTILYAFSVLQLQGIAQHLTRSIFSRGKFRSEICLAGYPHWNIWEIQSMLINNPAQTLLYLREASVVSEEFVPTIVMLDQQYTHMNRSSIIFEGPIPALATVQMEGTIQEFEPKTENPFPAVRPIAFGKDSTSEAQNL
jgi:hypothetical protein